MITHFDMASCERILESAATETTTELFSDQLQVSTQLQTVEEARAAERPAPSMPADLATADVGSFIALHAGTD